MLTEVFRIFLSRRSKRLSVSFHIPFNTLSTNDAVAPRYKVRATDSFIKQTVKK
jgi:hypothetical protein